LCAVLTAGAYICIRRIEEPRGDMSGEAEAEKGAADTEPPVKASRGRRIVRRLATTVVVAALLIVFGLPWLLSFAITKAGTRPDERALTHTPASYGAAFEDVTFASADGNQLSGWYLPAAVSDKHITIVLTHGLFRSRYEMLERGVELWRRGYGVLLYDLRRHGHSPAEFSTLGYAERRDVKGAMRFARERAPRDRVVLMGVSMGAAATLLATAEMEAEGQMPPLAVVAESSFLSFADTARHHVTRSPLPAFPFAPLLVKFTAWRLGFVPEEFDVLRAVEKVSVPVLFIGGAADERMPNATVLEPLFAAARHPLKDKLVVEGARHGRAFDPFEKKGEAVGAVSLAARQAYVDAVDQFIRRAAAAAAEGDTRPSR
ncbi:MAG: alpha/beta hydrolase, partial [Pyrinomonadaceae bacterium]